MAKDQDIALRLKLARVNASLGVNTAAERIGVTRQTLSAWERVGGIDPTDANLDRLANTYSVKKSWLLKGNTPTAARNTKPEERLTPAVYARVMAAQLELGEFAARYAVEILRAAADDLSTALTKGKLRELVPSGGGDGIAQAMSVLGVAVEPRVPTNARSTGAPPKGKRPGR